MSIRDEALLGEQLAYSGNHPAPVITEPWPDDLVEEHQGDDFTPDEYEIQERLRLLRINAEARRRLDEELRPQLSIPPIEALDVLLAEPDTPTQYRIDKLAPAGARVMLSAQYKAGKTTIVANLLRSLVDGERFLGRFDVAIPAKRIVLIDTELHKDTLKRWLREQEITNTSAISTVSLRGRLATFNLLDDRCRDEWSRKLSDIGADYLVLDCLRPILDALGLDENRDAGQFLVAFDSMLFGAGISDALMVQHMGHTGERSRGDSRLQDWPDAIWRLVRETEEPDSDRFLSAFGRDVNLPEGRLTYANRRLIYSDGNRADARTRAALVAIVECLVAAGEPLSGSALESNLESGHTRAAIRDGKAAGIKAGLIITKQGSRNAIMHTIGNPCQQCGRPVVGGGERHQSCPQPGDELVLP